MKKILDKIKEKNKNKDSVLKKLDPKKKYKIGFYKNGNSKLMGIYSDKNLLIGGTYNFYGIYQPNTKLWIWASSIPGVDIRTIKYINHIKSFDHLFEKDSNPINNFYYQLLTQDVLYIDNEKMIDHINQLLLYLSNDLYYFNPINSDMNVQFLTLSKIKEKFI
jgi:hypothetical protein